MRFIKPITIEITLTGSQWDAKRVPFAEAIKYAEDPNGLSRYLYGVSYLELLRAVEEKESRYGYPQCCATTKKGKRCKNSIHGVGYVEHIGPWLRGIEGYCYNHGEGAL